MIEQYQPQIDEIQESLAREDLTKPSLAASQEPSGMARQLGASRDETAVG